MAGSSVVAVTARQRAAGLLLGAALARGSLAAGRALATPAAGAPGRADGESESPAGASGPAAGVSGPAASASGPAAGLSGAAHGRPGAADGANAPSRAAQDGSLSRWDRTNYQGRTVSLLAGPALAIGAAGASALAPGVARRLRAAAALAAIGAGGFGLYDDLAGSGSQRGLRGHLSALRRGDVTTGVVKIGGLAATGLTAARIVGRRGPDALVSGAVVAGFANLFNLLDLRPGRALKVGLAHAGALALPSREATLLAAPLGAAAGLLPSDLGERTMLGDAGANALGAAIGVAAIATYGPVGRLAHLVGIVGLTLASERVSFTEVIEQTPPLRWLDGLGRRR